MKKRDLEKLRNAFDIPDPERKEEFLASYGDKFISRKKSCKKLALPRFAPVMALAVLFVCLLGIMKPEHDLRKNVGTDNIIIEATDTSTASATTAITTTTDDPPVRMTTTARSSGTVSVSSTTAAVSSKPDITVTAVVTTITETDEPTEFTENTSTAKTTAATTRKSTSKTTTTLSTSPKTSSSKSDIQVTTSENGEMGSVTTTSRPTSVSDDNVDYSVVPEIVYIPTDNIYETDIRNPPCGGNPDYPPPPDLVISGTIVEMIFTKMNSRPYTQFNVKIDSFIMGDNKYKNGDTISIYVMGGCMPAKEFFELFPDKLTYDLEITDDLTVFYIGELSDKYYPDKQTNFELDKSGSDFPENTFIIHK